MAGHAKLAQLRHCSSSEEQLRRIWPRQWVVLRWRILAWSQDRRGFSSKGLWGRLCTYGQERLSNNIGIGCKFKFKCKSNCSQQILRGYSDTMGKNRQRLIVLHMHNRGVISGGAGGAMVPPDFGRSVNPISTWGGSLCPPNNTGFSDLPTALV